MPSALPSPHLARATLALAACALVLAALALLRAPRSEAAAPSARAPTVASSSPRDARIPIGLAPSDEARECIDGMDGPIHWIDLLAGPGLGSWSSARPGCWRHEGATLDGALLSGGGSVLLVGDDRWHDYECSIHVACEAGGEADIRLRARDATHGYCVALLYGLQAMSVRLLDAPSPPRLLSCVDVPLAAGRAYDLRLAARGESITTYLGDRIVNQVTDATWSAGGCGVGVWQSRARFGSPRVRFLDGCAWRPPKDRPAAVQSGF